MTKNGTLPLRARTTAWSCAGKCSANNVWKLSLVEGMSGPDLFIGTTASGKFIEALAYTKHGIAVLHRKRLRGKPISEQ